MDFTRRRFPITVKSLCSNIHDEFLPSGPSDSGGDPRSPAESSVTAEEQDQRDVTVHQGNGDVFMATYHMWKFPGRNLGYPITYEVQPRHMVADAMQINKDYFKPRVFEYSDSDNKTDTPVESAPQGAAEQAQPETSVCAGKHISYKPVVVPIAIAEEDESEVFSSTTRTILAPPDRFSSIPLYPTPILRIPNSPSLQRRSVPFTVDTDFANIPSSTSALMQSEICDATQVQETSSICSDMAQSSQLPPTSSRRKSLFGVDLGRADIPTEFPGPARRRHSSTTYRGIQHGTSYASQLLHECQKHAAISRRKSRKQHQSEYHKGRPSLLERTGISLSDVRMKFSSLSKCSEQQNNDYGSDKDVLQLFPWVLNIGIGEGGCLLACFLSTMVSASPAKILPLLQWMIVIHWKDLRLNCPEDDLKQYHQCRHHTATGVASPVLHGRLQQGDPTTCHHQRSIHGQAP